MDIKGKIKTLKDQLIEPVKKKTYFVLRKLILPSERSDREKDTAAFLHFSVRRGLSLLPTWCPTATSSVVCLHPVMILIRLAAPDAGSIPHFHGACTAHTVLSTCMTHTTCHLYLMTCRVGFFSFQYGRAAAWDCGYVIQEA